MKSSSKAISGSASGAGAAGSFQPEDAAIDKTIVSAAVMNGALELLPQSLASMAIIPLQMKLVYGIGKSYGYELDRGHVKDLLATMGAGVTGQYLEDVGRKLLGGLFGKAAGGLLGGLAKGATGMAFSFATTWAIGQVAKLQTLEDNDENYVPPREMLRELMNDNKKVVASMRKAHDIADKYEDVATASILENFIDQAERRTWFLFEASRQEGANEQ